MFMVSFSLWVAMVWPFAISFPEMVERLGNE